MTATTGDRSTEQAAHTPGPWEIPSTNRRSVVASRGYENIASCGGKYRTDNERRANARLIAASPEMLAALELAADYIKTLDGGDPRTETGWKSDELLDVWLKARAAIAKATGAQS